MAELVLLVCMAGTLIDNNLVSKSWALLCVKAVLPESKGIFLDFIYAVILKIGHLLHLFIHCKAFFNLPTQVISAQSAI